MSIDEAIELQKALQVGLKETGKDSPYRDALIPLMKKSCDIAISALEAQKKLAEYKHLSFDTMRYGLFNVDAFLIDEAKGGEHNV